MLSKEVGETVAVKRKQQHLLGLLTSRPLKLDMPGDSKTTTPRGRADLRPDADS